MKKTISWIIGLICTIILTFAFYSMLKLITSKPDKQEQGEIPASEIVLDGKMTPEALLALGRISDPQVSPDGETILYGVSYTSIEENRACRNLFICNIDGSDRRQITHEGKSVNNARWIDNENIAYIQGGQIYAAKLTKKGLKKAVKVSDIPAGISEFKIAPDNGQIMYISTVPGPVKTPKDLYEDCPDANAYQATDLMHRHWDHWVTEIPHTFVAVFDPAKENSITADNSLDILGSDEAAFELPTEPFSGIEQLCWAPDGRHIAYSCRKKTGKEYAFSTNTEIYIYDILTGATVQVTNGGGYDTDPVWSPDGHSLAFISMARDGYEADQQRLMLAHLENYEPEEDGQNIVSVKDIQCISEGFKYNVAGPSWSEDGKTIWFNSLAEGLQAIFRADLVSEGDDEFWSISRITTDNDWHDYTTPFYVKDGLLLATWESMNFPTELVAIQDGQSIQISNENGSILGQLVEPEMEARMIKTVDGQDMLTWVLYPPQFDKSKVYPAITICLGGPQGTNSQSWSYRWCYRMMAEQGYIVILPNRRGTTAFGQEWCEQISGDYSGLNIQDYLSAARELKKESYVGKMAACGASYGGYSVYFLCGNHEDTFDCFIAHAGIFNEEHMYYTTEEMWFANWDNGGLKEYAADPAVGTENAPVGPAGDGITFGGIQQAGSPWSNAPLAKRHYANSPHQYVTKWHTPLLVMHGGSDFRVPVDEGMAAFNAAQMMGVPSKMVIFPDENHWILKPQNALFWHRTYFDWLDQWCK